ncbi:13575_t:CDS:2 [Racocetra persica]|uniref:13575_t:CDS:1 n=1 Tax=Racocetra persica TaxID=160502 RepID=A0ACA9PGL0_9GLOM|nr:13575_t:CDS:2 [Racocetra persica]
MGQTLSSNESVNKTMGQTQSSSELAEEEYQKYRKLAHDEAQHRNDYFAQSQEAFKNNEKRKAKELSIKGKEHAKKMEIYNSMAVEVIFSENNKGRPITEIDLHGLYVKEAMDKTESRIQYCKANKIDHLVIIVGRGKHSSGLAKLKPAIINLMKKYQLRCTPDKPTVGCLYVEFGFPGEPINIGWFDTFVSDVTNYCIIC